MSLFNIKRSITKKFGKKFVDIDPDEIFLDSKNLPQFDTHQFEGRIEKPITLSAVVIVSVCFGVLITVLLGRAWFLQINNGEVYAERSENNRLRHETIFSDRGAVFDKNGIKLVWNTTDPENEDFSSRSYIEEGGFSHVLGYIRYPSKDKNGFYYRKDFDGVQGIEKVYNDLLKGSHGLKILETDALGGIQSESIVEPAKIGENLTLSIDSKVQAKLYEYIKELADRVGFSGGAGGIMDVNTGEIIAMTSYPEYSSQAVVFGDKTLLAQYNKDNRKPFLDRFLTGLYTPGSVVKPFVALAGLSEKLIDPNKEIYTTGSISIQNPYDPEKKTVFNDWKNQGSVDMRKAIAMSSNVYFYRLGGGYEGEKGLGIDNINKYLSMFGFGQEQKHPFFGGPAGVVPSPMWKEKNFPGDPWRIGDTYFTSIGQYGFQVTPLQILRSVASIANSGFLLEPSILKVGTTTDDVKRYDLPFTKEQFKIIHEGMRMSATIGTASGLNVPFVEVAAKTGTAELGVSKANVNSWVMGFFPYKEPKYAFVVLMEHGPRANIYGGIFVMRELLDWMNIYASEYLN
jgi:penicillin-binding protein 2